MSIDLKLITGLFGTSNALEGSKKLGTDDLSGLVSISKTSVKDTKKIESAIRTGMDVIQDLSWMTSLGPVVTACFTLIKAMANTPKPDMTFIAETAVIEQLRLDFQNDHIHKILTKIKTINDFQTRLEEQTDNLRKSLIKWPDYLDMITRESGYRGVLTKLVSAGDDSIFNLLDDLFLDDDLNLNTKAPYKDKTHWNLAYRKLLIQQQSMTCLLRTYLYLITMDTFASKPQQGDLNEMNSAFNKLSKKLETVSHHMIHTRRAAMVKDVSRMEGIHTYKQKLENATEEFWANDKHRSSIFASMSQRTIPKVFPLNLFSEKWSSKIEISELVDSRLTELWDDKWSQGPKMEGWGFEDAGTGKVFCMVDDVIYNIGMSEDIPETMYKYQKDRKSAVEELKKQYDEIFIEHMKLLHSTFVEAKETWEQLIKTATSTIVMSK